MRVSICIPIYNTDAISLVTSLSQEMVLKQLESTVEIIVIDDYSSSVFKEKNKTLPDYCNYIKLGENYGRSKIRNKFLEYVKGDYLLFIDGDSLIPENTKLSFISNYLAALSDEVNCICGGRVYPKLVDTKNIELNYLYGIHKESKPLDERLKQPNRSFMTNNFLVKRTILEEHPFDEQLTQYGHEDTLFGIQLILHHIKVDHIDNPVLNGHIETNDIFLNKTKQAVENLFTIYSKSEDKKLITSQVTLLKWAVIIKKLRLKWFVLKAFNVVEKKWRSDFLNGKINLRKFDCYKLGLFLRLR